MLTSDLGAIESSISKLRTLRREYSHIVEEVLQSTDDYECEDLLRLIGHLQASYDHLLTARVHDGDVYCVVAKHLPACIILAGEVGIEVGPIYEILAILTDGKVKPCSACKEDRGNV